MSILTKVPVKMVGALRRPAWWLLAWSQRHTLGLWGRSIRAEVAGTKPMDAGRARRLVKALYKVTTDSRLTNSPGLRSLTVVGDELVAETDMHWPQREVLAAVLGGVDHVNGVRFASAPSR